MIDKNNLEQLKDMLEDLRLKLDTMESDVIECRILCDQIDELMEGDE